MSQLKPTFKYNKHLSQSENLKNQLGQSTQQSFSSQLQKLSISPNVFVCTSIDEKKIFLWDEKVCSTIFTYEDTSQGHKGITYNKIIVVNSSQFSSFIIASNFNKSLLTVFETSNSEPISKTMPVEEPITCMNTNNRLIGVGSSRGNVSLINFKYNSFDFHLQP